MALRKKRRSSTPRPVSSKKVKYKSKASTPSTPPTRRPKHKRLHPEAISLYNENAQTPLLSLPRELRDRIWTYLYGNLVLHPTRRRVHPLTFCICDAPQEPKHLYELSLQGASSDAGLSEENRAITWAAPELQSYHFCATNRQHQSLVTAELKVPIVCRQMWNEMSETVYETCTFAFTSSDDLFNFLSCRKAGLERVRKVLLSPEINPWYPGCLDASDLKWWSLKRMKGVRSLDLWVVWQLGMNYSRVEVGDGDWMGKKGREMGTCYKTLQNMVKQLRRWDLKSECTRVILDVRGPGGDASSWVQRRLPVNEKVQLAGQIMRALLKSTGVETN